MEANFNSGLIFCLFKNGYYGIIIMNKWNFLPNYVCRSSSNINEYLYVSIKVATKKTVLNSIPDFLEYDALTVTRMILR